jgi:glycerophosphoryl diester phosphodiesterase
MPDIADVAFCCGSQSIATSLATCAQAAPTKKRTHLIGNPAPDRLEILRECRCIHQRRFTRNTCCDRALATLKQFIETAGDRIRLSIELKYYGPEPRLVKAVVDVIHDESVGGRCEIISLDQNALAQVRLIDPTIRLGYLVFASLGDITRMNVDFLSVNKSLLKQSLRVRAQRHEMKLAVWTVNNRDEMLQMMAAGADELVTDDVALARGAVSDYKSLSDTELLLLRWRQALK